MATLRKYYESDFNYTVRMFVKIPLGDTEVEGSLLCDFAANSTFLSCYIPEEKCNIEFLLRLIRSLRFGVTEVSLDGKVTLPSPRQFPGELRVENKPDFEVFAHFWGDPAWVSSRELAGSTRVFIYSESEINDEEIMLLKKEGDQRGLKLQFRSRSHVTMREMLERPLAFISHDSRDKELIARPIAERLVQQHCAVWYDEYSLNVGDHLRESIEKGLKECKRCVLVLSHNFLTNTGWTSVEFNSIFTREIIERQKLVLPIWYDVTREEIFQYCPSLANVVALDWRLLGAEEICNRLARTILNEVEAKDFPAV